MLLQEENINFPKNVQQLLVDYDNEFIIPKADHFSFVLAFQSHLLELIKMNASVKQDFYKVDFELVYN